MRWAAAVPEKGKVTGGARYSGLSIKYTCSEAVKHYKQFVWLTKIQFAFWRNCPQR